MCKILITGGAGFIGCHLVRLLVEEKGEQVINLDKLTYASNAESLADLAGHPNYSFEQVDICDPAALGAVFAKHRPHAVLHLAAESHVDRSIDGPGEFIQTNIIGTFNLLQAALAYWRSLPNQSSAISHQLSQKTFRFLHVSTDEVYGSLVPDASGFSETAAYAPHSPYAASKASADHLVRAWRDTYGLPVLVTNCSNNYGPRQFPEKLIPMVILKCLRGEPIPVYGNGENVRDWIYVKDHAEALYTVLLKGRVGETYNIGGNNEWRNIDLIRKICQLMDEFEQAGRASAPRAASTGSQSGGNDSPPLNLSPTSQPLNFSTSKPQSNPSTSEPQNLRTSQPRFQSPRPKAEGLITFVADRPGHDLRYAIDASKIRAELGWEPKEDFESGLRKTVQWYVGMIDD